MMKTFREFIEFLYKEEDAPPPPDAGGGAPPPPPDAGGGMGGPPPDMGGGGPPPDMGGAPPGGAPVNTKMDVYEVWKDLSDYLKTKYPLETKKQK